MGGRIWTGGRQFDWLGENTTWSNDMTLYAGGGGVTYTPDLTNLVVWLDPSDNTQITQSGGLCSQITDKSGLGNTFTQSTGSKKPAVTAAAINGLQAFTFTVGAAGTEMDCTLASTVPSTNGWGIFALIKPTDMTQFNGIIGNYVDTAHVFWCLGATNNFQLYDGGGPLGQSTTNCLSNGTACWAGLTYDPAGAGTFSFYVNGVAKGTTGAAGLARALSFLGWSNQTAFAQAFGGVMGDVLVYSQKPSAGQISSTYTSFASPKWGV